MPEDRKEVIEWSLTGEVALCEATTEAGPCGPCEGGQRLWYPQAEGTHGWVFLRRTRSRSTPVGTAAASSGPALWGLRDVSVVTPSLSGFPKFISLTRPLDSHLEHVDFSSLLQCLSFEQILQIFASAVLERRIIFLAEGLRWVWPPSSSAVRRGILGVLKGSGGRTRVLPLLGLDLCCSCLQTRLGPKLQEGSDVALRRL